ncbi:MAG: glycine cleavage system protein GcvH [Myxococcota bacterium]
MEIPTNLYYSLEDEWVRQEDGRAVVGITDYAQDQLGDIVFVELPEVGASFAKGESFGVVESVKAVSDLYAPISGEIVEINETLANNPEAVNEGCYGDGWMVVFAPSAPEEIESLLDAEGYRKHVDDRSD